MSNELISVIVPNYNHSLFLKERIDSILEQTYSNFEIIILDDCSTDNSREIIEAYRNNPKVYQIIYNENNSGSTFKQWNKGIGLARGEYIWIAESDDYAKPRLLEVLYKGFEDDSGAVLSYTQSYRMNKEGVVTGNWREQTMNMRHTEVFDTDFTMPGIDFIQKFLIYKNVIPNVSAVLFKKNAYLKVGGVDMQIKYCADWLLWLKLGLEGDIFFSEEKLNYFRYHSESVIGSFLKSKNKFFPRQYDIYARKSYNQYLDKHSDFPSSCRQTIKEMNFACLSRDYLDGAYTCYQNNKCFLALENLLNAVYYSKDPISILRKFFRYLSK